MNVDFRREAFHGAADVDIKVDPVYSGWIPPCMQTSVAPRPPPCLVRAPLNLVKRAAKSIGLAAGGSPLSLPLEKRKKPAAEGAYVGVVDVAIDDNNSPARR